MQCDKLGLEIADTPSVASSRRPLRHRSPIAMIALAAVGFGIPSSCFGQISLGTAGNFNVFEVTAASVTKGSVSASSSFISGNVALGDGFLLFGDFNDDRRGGIRRCRRLWLILRGDRRRRRAVWGIRQ